MKIFTLSLLLLPFAFLSSYSIGIVHNEPYKYSTVIPFADEVIKALQKHHHRAEFVSVKTPEKLGNYDYLITLSPFYELDPFFDNTIIYIQEPPIVEPRFRRPQFYDNYLKVFYWDHKKCDGRKFFKAFFPYYEGIYFDEFIPFDKRKLVCQINSLLGLRYPGELYSERDKVVRFYNRKKYKDDFSLYGKRGITKSQYPRFLGNCEDKGKVMRQHKFCYIYENWDNSQYYISEKILDCIQSRCLPIYLGSSKISDYIPKECYIDARAFSSTRKIHQFISEMDEETWLTYIHAMEAFDASEMTTVFTKEFYIQQILDVVDSL